jgi:hypothetical protein
MGPKKHTIFALEEWPINTQLGSHVYNSCRLDAESEQNILHSITQYLEACNE